MAQQGRLRGPHLPLTSFGKGRHPAALNLGDCFTYGLAITVGEPVLCVGDDFHRTDVDVVPLPS